MKRIQQKSRRKSSCSRKSVPAKPRRSGRRPRKQKPSPPVFFQPNSAGIDIGATEIFVAVPEDRDTQPVRSFGTYTAELRQAARWLKSCRIERVAMESTGVYWIPVFQILEEAGLEVCLVNARHVKNVPGRKTDAKDCQWLQYLHSVGLLEKSFRPAAEICAVRSLLRHRQNLMAMINQHTQHMHKSLTQMNLQLHHVLKDVTGQSGLRILDAILNGQRNRQALAALCDKRVKASQKEIMQSLEGDYRPEHLFVLGQALAAYRFTLSQVEQLDQEVLRMVQKLSAARPDKASPPLANPGKFETVYDRTLAAETARAFGVDLTSIPCVSAWAASNLLSEIGPDVEAWKSEKHFASWLALCPNNQISGGKVLSSSTRRAHNRAKYILRMCAYAASHSKSPIGDYFRRMRSRLGPAQAYIATAHKLARVTYRCIKTGQPYDEQLRKRDTEAAAMARFRRLSRQAEELGLLLLPKVQLRRNRCQNTKPENAKA